MRHLLFLILTVLTISGCSKEKAERDTVCLDGTIQWQGSPAADGLGWVLMVNTESPKAYILNDLPAAYQQSGLDVAACIYISEEKRNCMCAQPLDMYNVSSIRKR